MRARPSPTAVTAPAPLTVATAASELLHCSAEAGTAWPLESTAVTVSVRTPPTTSVSVRGDSASCASGGTVGQVYTFDPGADIAGTIGGYAGARVARRVKPEYIRAFVVFIGFAVAFYSWFGKK